MSSSSLPFTKSMPDGPSSCTTGSGSSTPSSIPLSSRIASSSLLAFTGSMAYGPSSTRVLPLPPLLALPPPLALSLVAPLALPLPPPPDLRLPPPLSINSLKFQMMFDRYAEYDWNFIEYFPTNEDWKNEVCDYFGVVEDVKRLISGSLYPTINLFPIEVYMIKELLNEKLFDPQHFMYKMTT